MSDRVDARVERVGEVLRDTLRAPPPELPLRRHRDDDYWDRVTVASPSGPTLTASIVPRFKTSGLSGSEWRVSAALILRSRAAGSMPTGLQDERPILLERRYHRMGGRVTGLLHYAPYHAYAAVRASASRRTRALFDAAGAVITVERKGVVLMREERPTFGDAVLGLAWHLVSANEGREGIEWHHLTPDEERQHCQQVGCPDAPVNFYRLLGLQAHPNASRLMKPEYDWEGQYTWYCARHTTRGDGGLEDSDRNLELIVGPGSADPDPSDAAPSALRVLRV